MTTIPTREPAILRAGDTWRWKRADLTSFNPASGWTLSYVLINSAGKIEFSATADGVDFLVDEAAADTASHAAGVYSWFAYVSNDPDRFEVGTGTVEVRPDLAAAAVLDTRSHARKVLEAIEAVLERRATKDQEEYSIEGRSLKRTPIADLVKLRDRYRAEVDSEIAAERLAQGLGTGRKILTRFRG